MEGNNIESSGHDQTEKAPLPLRINAEIFRISKLLESTNQGGRGSSEPSHLGGIIERLKTCKTEEEFTKLRDEAFRGVDGGRQDPVETRLDDLR